MHKLSKWYMIEKLFNAFKNPTQLMKLKKNGDITNQTI